GGVPSVTGRTRARRVVDRARRAHQRRPGHRERRKLMNALYRWPEYDAVELHRARFARVQQGMREDGLDALLLVGPDHIRYATDFRAHLTNESEWFAALVHREGDAELFLPYIDETVDAPYPAMPWISRVHPVASWSAATANPRTW